MKAGGESNASKRCGACSPAFRPSLGHKWHSYELAPHSPGGALLRLGAALLATLLLAALSHRLWFRVSRVMKQQELTPQPCCDPTGTAAVCTCPAAAKALGLKAAPATKQPILLHQPRAQAHLRHSAILPVCTARPALGTCDHAVVAGLHLREQQGACNSGRMLRASRLLGQGCQVSSPAACHVQLILTHAKRLHPRHCTTNRQHLSRNQAAPVPLPSTGCGPCSPAQHPPATGFHPAPAARRGLHGGAPAAAGAQQIGHFAVWQAQV